MQGSEALELKRVSYLQCQYVIDCRLLRFTATVLSPDIFMLILRTIQTFL
jgi:hypothetical protein